MLRLARRLARRIASSAPATAHGAARPRPWNMGVAYVQVLGNGRDCPPSLLLFFDDKRYLFNCGEGLQRLCTELRVRLLSKFSHVFLTRLAWENVGGLPGLLLTVADSIGGASVRLTGPPGPGLAALVRAWRHVLTPHSRAKIDISVADGGGEPVFRDENVTVTTVPLAPHSLGVCYLCQTSDVPGAFNNARAKELGVPRDERRRVLVAGQPVTLDDGRVIRPEDVTLPPQPGVRFVVVECDDRPGVEALRRSPDVQRFAAERQTRLVAHLTPASVLQSAEYVDWMRSFGPQTQHIVTHESVADATPIFLSTVRNMCRAHAIHGRMFPLPFGARRDAGDDTALGGATALPAGVNIAVGRPAMKFHLLPVKRQGVDLASIPPPLDIEGHVAEGKDWSSQACVAAATPQPPPKPRPGHELASASYELTFLGTGSAVPSKYRNVSSILLHIEDRGGVLLDAGEGTYGQLFRRFGRALDDVLERLALVHISHIHADHLLGALRILKRREQVLRARGRPDAPLAVIGPAKFGAFLGEYSAHCEPLQFRFFDGGAFVRDTAEDRRRGDRASVAGLLADLRETLGLADVQNVRVDHCPDAYGVALVHEDGWKVVYSGDTRPCDALVSAGRGASVLVHEATFEDSMVEEAQKRRHCTTSEAVAVAQAMQAERTILTHFSQRYPHVPNIAPDQLVEQRIAIAVDLMTVRSTDMAALPATVPPLAAVLSAGALVDAADEEELAAEEMPSVGAL